MGKKKIKDLWVPIQVEEQVWQDKDMNGQGQKFRRESLGDD